MSQPVSRHHPAPDPARVRGLILRLGLVAAAHQLGVGREALARASGGLALRRGTAALICAGLDAAEKQPATSTPKGC